MSGSNQLSESKMAKIPAARRESQNLLLRLSIDTATAFTAATLVAPAMTMIDQ